MVAVLARAAHGAAPTAAARKASSMSCAARLPELNPCCLLPSLLLSIPGVAAQLCVPQPLFSPGDSECQMNRLWLQRSCTLMQHFECTAALLDSVVPHLVCVVFLCGASLLFLLYFCYFRADSDVFDFCVCINFRFVSTKWTIDFKVCLFMCSYCQGL